MTTKTYVFEKVVKHREQPGEERCPCGCAECPAESCDLTCLERPHFSPGQVLTVETMETLVTYTRARLALNRYRDGWGVVCGLQVQRDPHNPNMLVIQPGYAIDCCGRDLVVCEPASKNLVPVFRHPDPCFRSGGGEGGSELTFGSRTFTGVQMADLYLRFKEQGAAPEVAFKSVARQESRCAYTRTREAFELHVERVQAAFNPRREWVMDWLGNLRTCLDTLNTNGITPSRAGGGTTTTDGNKLKDEWLYEHPPRTFGFLAELTAPDLATAAGRGWLVLDYLIGCLPALCDTCGPAAAKGIPLARVWVQVNGAADVRILAIDAQPPYRRDLLRDQWPAPLGRFNLGQLVWRRVGDAQAILREHGISSITSSRKEIDDLPTIWVPDASNLMFHDVTKQVALVCLNHDLFGERVVGFWGTTSYTVSGLTEGGGVEHVVPGPSLDSAFDEGVARKFEAAGINTVAEVAHLTQARAGEILGIRDKRKIKALIDRAKELDQS